MKARQTLALALFLCVPALHIVAESHTVTFDDLAITPVDAPQKITISPITFNGGNVESLLYNHVPLSYPWNSHVYWTHNDNGIAQIIPGLTYTSSLRISFSRRASHIEFTLGNFLPSFFAAGPLYTSGTKTTNYRTVRFVLIDDHGNSQVESLTGYDPYNVPTPGQTQQISFKFDNVKTLTITPSALDSPSLLWEYAIDNVTFDARDDQRFAITLQGETKPSWTLVADDSKATLPLGARFDFSYEERQPDNTWLAVSSGFDVSPETVDPPLPATLNDAVAFNEPLFPQTVLFPFDATQNAATKTFQVVHKGDATVTLTPEDATTADDPIRLSVTVSDPSTLGIAQAALPYHPGAVNNTSLDAAFVRRAHWSGIPPQYLKAQSDQETGDTNLTLFSPFAFRYEPITKDFCTLQDHYQDQCSATAPHLFVSGTLPQQLPRNAPEHYSDFGLPSGFRLCPGSSTCLADVDDFIAPHRKGYLYCDNGHPTLVPANGLYPTARQYLSANPREGWVGDPTPQPLCGSVITPTSGRSRAVRSVQDVMTFTAQTALASSYGLLQVIPMDVMGSPFFWTGYHTLKNPSLFFDTAANIGRGYEADNTGDLRAGASSLKFGVMRDVRLYHVVQGGVADDPLDFSTPQEFDDQLRITFNLYPGGDSLYGPRVLARTTQYLPQKATPTVFSTTCSPPQVSAAATSLAIQTGSVATLSVDVSNVTSAVYDWYLDTTSGSQRISGSGASDNIAVQPLATSQYHATVTTECGSTNSPPITVVVTPACAPLITTPPSASVTGTTATLSVGASGSGNTYGWFIDSNDTAVAGFSVPPVIAAGASTTVPLTDAPVVYRAIVSNSCGFVTSESVLVPSLSGSSCVPISIIGPPTDISVVVGSAAPLSVAASGTSPYTYQWYAGSSGDVSSPVPGANSSTIAPISATTTSYWVRVSNSCSRTDSTAAVVTVSGTCQPVSISSQSSSQQIQAGDPVSLTVSVAGTSPVSYQWYGGSAGDTTQPIAGANSTVYIPTPQTTSAYWVRTTNLCGQADSGTIAVSVSTCARPSITTQPLSDTIVTDSTTTVRVAATGQLPLSYQWYLGQAGDGSHPIDGATGTSLSVTPSATTPYWVQVTNPCGSTNSRTATLTTTTACIAPTLVFDINSTTIVSGKSGTLRATALGTDPLTYQWYVGSSGDTSTPVSGSNGSTLAVSPTETTSYWVRVTNPCGSADSPTGTITVVSCEPAEISSQPTSITITQGSQGFLSVEASGTDTITAQWFIGVSGDESQPTNLTAFTIPVSPSETTSYWALVSNACGTAISAAATVVVLPACSPATIEGNPSSAQLTSGSPTTLSVVASGTSPIAYQWFLGASGDESTPISGATASTVTVTPTSTADYWVEVTNACGIAASYTATVTVLPPCTPPQILTGPVTQTIEQGDSVQLSVDAIGSAPLAYSWFAGDVPDTAQPVGSGSTVILTPSATTSYWVRISNACGVIDSNAAAVTVALSCIPPTVSITSSAITINLGDNVSLSATPSGTAPFTFDWYRGAPSDISEPLGDGRSLTFTPTVSSTYWVRATNSCGTSDSSGVAIAVVQPCDLPAISLEPGSQTVVNGGSVRLSVEASGTTPLSYQWYENGTPFAGATDTTLTVTPIETTNYFVRITNPCGHTDSDVATIAVATCNGCGPGGGPQQVAGTLLSPPAHLTAVSRTRATIDVSWATATPVNGPVFYQLWRAGGSGPFKPVATTSSVTRHDQGLLKGHTYRYFVIATDSSGSRVSGPSNIATATAY
ncbi:MAG TPA: hypothetical protein VGJ81_19210 [Thermoanaerobaculia bacterium]|jgi:hypothetical protein